jgi:hypothetical protein
MLKLRSIRSGAGAATRRGLGLLAIVWLNLALTPCAVAFDTEGGCAHDPPSGHQDMAGHHDHGEQKEAHSCASMHEACCEIADASVDSRGGSIEFDNSTDLEVLAAYPPDQLATKTLARYLATADPPDPPVGNQPLHKLFCVYLK